MPKTGDQVFRERRDHEFILALRALLPHLSVEAFDPSVREAVQAFKDGVVHPHLLSLVAEERRRERQGQLRPPRSSAPAG